MSGRRRQLGAGPSVTRPYRPQTNGKVERFNRTLLDEWAYLRPYASNQTAPPPWTAGCTCTTITAPTPHSAATHPSAASTTPLTLTASEAGTAT